MSEWFEDIRQSRVVNPKKSLRLRNNTKYFIPETVKTHNEFSSPFSFEFRRIKTEGYENRLYWQYKYCLDNGGLTFFYTLTYNDKSVPRYLGRPCFDYEDLRELFTGGFRKQLLRKYGCTFKYFVGAELGDGKGVRGLFNNPHYHVLFFLLPKPFTYLRKVVEQVPAGFYVRNSRYHNVGDKKFKRVIHRVPTTVCGVPSPEDFRHLVRLYWQGFDEDTDGFRPYSSARYGIAREGDKLGLVYDFRACVYCAKYCVKDVGLKSFEKDVARVLRFNLSEQFSGSELEEQVQMGLSNYRNRYCNKCRISQGVGDYALEYIGDKLSPSIPFPTKDGFKYRPIGMYYYRKLFTDVYVDVSGSNIRVLNDDGIRYKCNRLSDAISKCIEKTASQVSIVDRYLFERMVDSDVNTEVIFSYDDYQRMCCGVSSDLILQRYAEFKLVYKDRYFFFDRAGYCLPDNYPPIDVFADYARFLNPSFFSVDRSDFRLTDFLDKPAEDWVSYYSHPYFLPYVRFFALFDLVSDYLFIQRDNQNEKDAEERARVRRYHNRRKLDASLLQQ